MTPSRTDLPRSYTHDALCSPDHDQYQCLTHRTEAAQADMVRVVIAVALFGGTR